VAWGLGAEAPTQAEAQEYIEQQKDLLRKRGMQVPATAARTETSAACRRWWNALDALGPSIRMVFGVRSGLRRPRRLTVLAIAGEAPMAVFYALRVPRDVQRHLVIEPRRVLSPLEYSPGTRPVKPMKALADGDRCQPATSAARARPCNSAMPR
jgi:hypothetical protein